MAKGGNVIDLTFHKGIIVEMTPNNSVSHECAIWAAIARGEGSYLTVRDANDKLMAMAYFSGQQIEILVER